MVIAICGNIASGKSTLAKFICQNYKFTYIPQKRIEMDFLQDFFDDIPRYFFPTQLSFLLSKAMQIKEAISKGENVVIDRSFLEDIHVFARFWIEGYDIEERVRKLYLETAEYIIASLPGIDLYVLCECSPIESRRRLGERKRRDFERKYPENYIDKLYGYLQELKYPEEASFAKINTEKWDFTKTDILSKIVAEIFWKYNDELEKRYHQISIFSLLGEENVALGNETLPSYIDEYAVGSNGNKLNMKALKREKLTVYLAAPFTAVVIEKKEPERYVLFEETGRQHGVLPEAYQKQLKRIKKQMVDRWKVKVILPHEDINDWGRKELSSDVVLREIVDNITRSDAMVVIPGQSIGAHLETGIAIAQHKPVVVFQVEEMENSFYVSNFDVLKGVWRYQVKYIDEIVTILEKKEVLEHIKKYLEAQNDKMDQ